MRSKPSTPRLAAAVAATATTFASLFPAQAATFVPTKLTDSADGFCDADCSLREAVLAANANPGADTIALGVGRYELTRFVLGDDDTGLGGDLDVTDGVTIAGAGLALTLIDANGPDTTLARVLDVHAGTVVLRDLLLTGGDAQNGIGGGIRNRASLTLTRVGVGGNQTRARPVLGGTTNGGIGGGVFSDGTLVVEDSLISQNLAHGGLLGVFCPGAPNDPALGSGVYVAGGTALIRNSTVSSSGTEYACESSEGYLTSQIYAAGGTVTLEYATVYPVVTLLNLTVPTLGWALDGNPVAGSIVTGDSILEGGCRNGFGSAVASTGYNIDPIGACTLAGPSDLVANPLLGGLFNNGGGTPYLLSHALLPGSPARDTANSAGCPATDMRGVARDDGACDRGAYEVDLTGCAEADGDGYSPDAGLCGPVDCDDTRASVNPSAPEVPGNGLDDNCNGQIDEGGGCAPVRSGGSGPSGLGTFGTVVLALALATRRARRFRFPS